MAITPRIREQMFQRAAATGATNTMHSRALIRIPLSRQRLVMPIGPVDTPSTGSFPHASAFGSAWTPAEHELFLEGLEMFPSGPWKAIADFIGTKTARQTMTHAQKYRQKIERRRRTLEQQAREQQSAENATEGAAAQLPISAVTMAPVTMALALGSNNGDLRLECESELNVVPGWDVMLQESILESSYNGERSDDDDLNHQLVQQHMRDAGNLADQQLLHECAELLGGEVSSPSLVPWSLDEPFALEGPDIGSLVADDGDSALEFALLSEELTRVNHENIQIWFGESERESEYQ